MQALRRPLGYDLCLEDDMSWQDYVEQRPDVMLGKPVFKGTRITVEHVLQELGAGTGEEELLRAHPRLTREHLRAAMLYAAAMIGMQETLYS
jgi:uncharacterized protein (DUF433 family)